MTDKLIPDAAVAAIQDSVRTAEIKVAEDGYTTRPVYLPPKDPTVDYLAIHTLKGLVDYYKGERSPDFDTIHVVSHREVRVISEIYGRHKQRDVYAVATADAVLDCNFRFGEFMEIEQFIIALQTLFVEDGDRAGVLKLVGNIKSERVTGASDDGVTQTVTAKAGVALVREVEVPNPVTLRPYRTFRELDQPASPFILRMRQGREGSLPLAALFEADGGGWKLEAIESIRDYLREKLSDAGVIA